MRTLLFVGIATMAMGCGEPDVEGRWEAMGGTDGQQNSLELHQDGNVLTGRSCEWGRRNCHDIVDGKLQESVVTYSFTIGDERFDAKLTLGEDEDGGGDDEADLGQPLEGEIRSSKCDCAVPYLYYRN